VKQSERGGRERSPQGQDRRAPEVERRTHVGGERPWRIFRYFSKAIYAFGFGMHSFVKLK